MKDKIFRILVLDGGGSKGVYTIGVLKELEKKLGDRLYKHFNLVYGTSTGAIIASLIALGEDINTVENLYFELVPKIMSGYSKKEKSNKLRKEADRIFLDRKFDSFKTDIGIVAFNYDFQQPLIFKSNINQAFGMKQSFVPGFGCTISEALQASCAAYPIFEIKKITTSNQGVLRVIDGGFIANNATLFAFIDAHKAFGVKEADIRLLNIGVGRYIEKPLNCIYKLLGKINLKIFIENVLTANTSTNDILSKLLFPNLHIVRICDTFNEHEYETNMIETDEKKLMKLVQLGRISFAKNENSIVDLFNN